MSKRVLVLVLVVLVAAAIPLALLLQGSVRGWVESYVMRVYLFISSSLEAVNQAVLWWFFIGIVSAVALLSVLGTEGAPRTRTRAPWGGKVGEWRWWLEQAAHPSRHSGSYRWIVARNLARLGIAALADRERISPEEAQERLEQGELDVPVAVRAYFLAGLKHTRFTHLGFLLHRLPSSLQTSPLDLGPEQAVGFLERILEVSHDDHDR